MHSATRRVFVKQIKLTKWHRKMSLSARLKTDDYIIKSPLSDVVIPDKNFLDVLWEHSAGFKNHTALVCAETRKSYTYQQLMDNVDGFATSLLKKFGLQPGDVIGLMLPNCPEFSVVAFGALRAGCKLTAINPIYKEYELCHQASITEPKLVVTIPECYETVVKGLKAAKSNAKIIILDRPNVTVPSDAIKFTEIAENVIADHSLLSKVQQSKDATAFLPFSSGTTGLPKGVEITYHNLLAACALMAHEKCCYPKLATDDFQDVIPCVLPFFHIYGLVVSLIGHLRMGCKLVSIPRFSPSLYFDVLKNDKASLLYIVPPIAILLGKHPDVGPDHLKHVRRICSGAAPLSASDIGPILEKCKNNTAIGQGYGATETTSLVTSTPIGFPATADKSASGVAMSNTEMKFVDPGTGMTVPVGEQGELYVRGPTVMKGYYKNEQATKDSLTEDGYFKTGDLGYYKDGDGLYITDRIKELIKVKGMQVAPAELESVLRSHPDVADAAVIGVPHEIYGETPKAFIITKYGKEASSEDIQNFVASKVAPYKKIEEVQFVKDIPKTASGKILRRELKNMYA